MERVGLVIALHLIWCKFCAKREDEFIGGSFDDEGTTEIEASKAEARDDEQADTRDEHTS